jgi:hypothetical protein
MMNASFSIHKYTKDRSLIDKHIWRAIPHPNAVALHVAFANKVPTFV